MAWGVGSLTVTAFPQTAVSDGIKRAVRLFGDGLGNCISDKDYLKDVKAGHYQHATRVTSFHEQAAAAAQSLQDQAAQLEQIVGVFKLS